MRPLEAFVSMCAAFLAGLSLGDGDLVGAALFGVLAAAYFSNALTGWMDAAGQSLAAPLRRRNEARRSTQSDEAGER